MQTNKLITYSSQIQFFFKFVVQCNQRSVICVLCSHEAYCTLD